MAARRSPEGVDDGERTGVAAAGLEALFVIDDRQRIVEWSTAAAASLGVPKEAALGRACYEVVQGHGPFGRAVCCANCPALKALRHGHLKGHCALLLPGEGGSREWVLCELVALPKVPGGAVIRLTRPRVSPSARARSALATAAPRLLGVSAGDIVHDLASLATLSTSLLVPQSVERSIELALEWLRQAANAEAAELFLAEPRGGDMLLTAYRGPFPTAFAQITRFRPGEGFPGLVYAHQEPIVTGDLRADARYLRTLVKDRQFCSYLCMPLLGPGRLVGAFGVASRRPDLDLARALRLLTWASVPLSAALQAGLLRVQDAVAVESSDMGEDDVESSLDRLLRGILRHVLTLGGADGGALLLFDRAASGVIRRVTEGTCTDANCPEFHPGVAPDCPALAGGHGVALHGSRRSWLPACRRVPSRGAVAYCVPIIAAGEPVGIIQIAYQEHGPSPPTRKLGLLLEAAERAAGAVKEARDRLAHRRRAVSAYRPWHQSDAASPGDTGAPAASGASGALTQWPGGAGQDGQDGHATAPYLEIRCFGPFEVRRRGVLVTPGMFVRRKALTLLEILLTHRGRPVPSDTLVELLWPETAPDSGMNRLYVAMHALRQVVEPPESETGWTFIRSNADRYCFNTDAPYRLDVEDFLGHVRLGRRAEERGDLDTAIGAYEAAVQLYRGDFLEDEPFAEWCWMEREHLRETYLDVLRKLAALCTQAGDLERSIACHRRALRVDPLREEAHQALLRCLWQVGRREEALRQYEACRDLLRRELDIAPLPETQALAQRIRGGPPR